MFVAGRRVEPVEDVGGRHRVVSFGRVGRRVTIGAAVRVVLVRGRAVGQRRRFGHRLEYALIVDAFFCCCFLITVLIIFLNLNSQSKIDDVVLDLKLTTERVRVVEMSETVEYGVAIAHLSNGRALFGQQKLDLAEGNV